MDERTDEMVDDAVDAGRQPEAELADRVGIVVTTHAGIGSMLTRCLDSLAATTPRCPVVVVDNSDGAGRDHGDHPDHTDHTEYPFHGDPDTRLPDDDHGSGPMPSVTVRRCANRGFGAAANLGFADPAIAACDYVMLLNDDVTVVDGWLDPLVRALDADPRLGAVQPTLLLAGTDPVLINSLGVTIDRYGAGSDLGYRTRAVDVAPSVTPIEAFTGGAVLLRRAFLDDVGGFDERYFLYYEDVDLSLRGAERGWRYACALDAVVEHEKGATTSALDHAGRVLQERNRLVTAARFGSWPTVGRALWLSVRRLRHQPRAAHRRALVGGLARMPRALMERRGSGA